MAALSEQKLEIVRSLIETAPDHVVGGLHSALAAASGEAALTTVRRIVEVESRDRQLRNLVLQPIQPMCVGDGRDPEQLIFPVRVLGLLWRGLKAEAPDVVREAELALYDYRPGVTSTEPFDHLVRIAADGVRARERREFILAAELCEEARPGGAEALIACLDLAGVVRSVAHKLPEWAAQQGEEAMVGSRLAYKDAVAIAPDAGPRFFHMLAGQLQHDWMILRIISAVMDRPTERYLAESELGGFGQRIVAGIESSLKRLARIDVDAGPAAAFEAARLVDRITTEANELETFVSLTRERGWGLALLKHRKTLANTIEGRMRECERYFHQALPSGRAKLKRVRRNIPMVNAPPDEVAVARCQTLLLFANEIRHSANYGGFASVRGKLLDTLGEQLDLYVEELLDLVKTGEVESLDNARAYMRVAADMARLIRDDKASELIRRRGAAAFSAAAGTAPELRLASGT
jgi:hypothetical protein